MKKFKLIHEFVEKRKGGAQELQRLLTKPLTELQLKAIPDDRYLAQMTRCVFNAGFHWRVITAKWGGFEEAFHGFDLGELLTKSPDEWEAYQSDERIVRNWQKIQTVFHNAAMIDELAEEHGSFANFIAQWPASDQAGLMKFLKKEGSRLGGRTCQWFIRFIGKDGYLATGDVVTALIANGVDINENPTSQRDMQRIQDAFNHWHDETGLSYSDISKILSYSVGDNISVDVIESYHGTQKVV